MLFPSMMFWHTLFVLSAALLAASQSATSAGTPTATESGVVLPSSTAGLDPCMETCFESAAAANSCALDDVHCVCASAQLQADLTQCLDAECSAFASPQAQGLLTQLCNKVQVVATGSAIPGHLSLSSAVPTSTSGLPPVPVQNQQSNGASECILAYVYLVTVVIATIVVGSLAWNWT